MMRTFAAGFLIASGVVALGYRQTPQPPLRLAIAGLVHGHVSGVLQAAQARPDGQIVVVLDTDAALLRKYAERYKRPEAVLFSDADAMITATKPEAVAAF